MIGQVIGDQHCQGYATLSVLGCSEAVRAPISEIKNARPKRLDIGEIVSCTPFRDKDGLCAKDVEILTGVRERVAIHQIEHYVNGSLGQPRRKSDGNQPQHRGRKRVRK